MTKQQIEMKLRVLAALGIDAHKHTAKQWLELAIKNEETAKMIGHNDVSYEYFVAYANRFLDAAVLREYL